MAPEILHVPDNADDVYPSSLKGDVYSFGMTLLEVRLLQLSERHVLIARLCRYTQATFHSPIEDSTQQPCLMSSMGSGRLDPSIV